MKVLVTGANGFLGRHVVAALRAAGHQVRALVRPAADVSKLGWGSDVEVFRADLRAARNLEQAFDGVDALMHLAAAVGGTTTSSSSPPSSAPNASGQPPPSA